MKKRGGFSVRQRDEGELASIEAGQKGRSVLIKIKVAGKAEKEAAKPLREEKRGGTQRETPSSSLQNLNSYLRREME